MTDYIDATGTHCTMIDQCATSETVTGAYNLLMDNFKRHYENNRSPFPMFMHAGGLIRFPAIFKGM